MSPVPPLRIALRVELARLDGGVCEFSNFDFQSIPIGGFGLFAPLVKTAGRQTLHLR